MAKVVNMAKAIQQKQEEKQAMRLLKELKEYKKWCDYTGDKITPEMLEILVKDNLEWWAM